ncbi:uncharacterized protein LOC133707098 [Rosa rugosa]|uniref:uncharacterized protein LOC133707098 n=1 Tax=Rosa rugosa TaxID=74645 RepID=UPI002B410191|nr:uncharacterized protein LOC133707098 [Rosa rugosa]
MADEQKQRVVLNPADCDIGFNIEGNGLLGSSLYEKGLAYCWFGARANMGITGGKYCFGCKVVSFQSVQMEDTDPEDRNLCRVGISRGDDVVGSLGETSHSFGYEGTGKFWNATRSPCYGGKFGLGDTIVCAVNLEEKPLASISFSKNGKCLGTAMKFNALVDPEVKNFQWESAFFPHLLLKNVEVELQFSVEGGLVPEDGFKPWAAALGDGNAIGGPVFDDPKDCEVMMMVGMPASGKTTWAEKWVKEHPEKRYVLLGINMVLDQMKVPGHLRKQHKENLGDPYRLECLMIKASYILDSLLSRATARAATSPRNYILDRTYVDKDDREYELRQFNLFKQIAVVVFPSPEEVKTRLLKRFEDFGSLGPADILNEMLANFALPVTKDVPCSDELFDEVMFVELNRDESHKLLEEMKQEESDVNSNYSSPYSCRNFDESYPFSPKYGERILPHPTPSPQYEVAPAVNIGVATNAYPSAAFQPCAIASFTGNAPGCHGNAGYLNCAAPQLSRAPAGLHSPLCPPGPGY